MKNSIFLILCFLVTVLSCTKEEVATDLNSENTSYESSNPQAQLNDQRRRGAKRPVAHCCSENMLQVEPVSSTPLCCTYDVTVDHTSVPPWGCPVYLETPQGLVTIGPGQVFTQQLSICRNHISQGHTNFVIGVYHTSNMGDVYCQTETISSECLVCPFTFDEGVNVGCGFGNQAEAMGCCDPSCFQLYLTTISDFQVSCPEYVAGVQAGWAACNCDDGGTPPVLCGGEPAPFPGCVCVDDDWWDC